MNALRRASPVPAVQWGRLLLLGGLLVGFAVRLYRLGAESLWYDETVSVHLARLPLAEMVQRTAGDIHPPGYYALLHLWHGAAQPSLAHGLEFLFGWPSLAAGLLAMPLLYAIGRRLFGEPAGLAALWLAAVNPFAVWYSQEVRMYTLGAALGLLCLWAVLKFTGFRGKDHGYATACVTTALVGHRYQHDEQGNSQTKRHAGSDDLRQWAWLLVYVLAAAAGLYTLYYFLFLLLALNLVALLLLWLYEGAGVNKRRAVIRWLLAQLAVLLLWSPWLPTFWRQATDPPVPPWRSGWDTPAALLHSLKETLAALLVGQTPPAAQTWPWAILAALLTLVFLMMLFLRKTRTGASGNGDRLSAAIVLIFVFTPIAVLYVATLAGAPIYHVRYLATYAPLFLLVPAVVLVAAWRRAAWLGMALGAGLLGISALSLADFWTNPLHRADDHRAAVAELARAWRPGDALLLNAGWITPLLTTYWPNELPAADASAPPPLQESRRLIDYAQFAGNLSFDTPPVIRTGSIGGSPSLGWGDPASDFFAISRQETEAGLQTIADQARRIWHYRLYDTVSDPDGLIRAWLAEYTGPLLENPIPGRDFGLLQLFETAAATHTSSVGSPLATFGGAITLLGVSAPQTVTAGSYLYTDLDWEALPPLAGLPTDLSTSLRLYDAAGQQVAQADGPPAPLPTRGWEVGTVYHQAAALPVPANLPPGLYALHLIVYRQDTAEALTVGEGEERSLQLSTVTNVGRLPAER